MFLSTSQKGLAGLLLGLVLFLPRHAWADAKQCVEENNHGAELRDQHHLLAARDAYRACVAEPECPAIVRSECDAALADIKGAVPTLLVAVLDEHGHDLAGATLSVDGRNVPIDGSLLEVDPGAHELIARRDELSSHLQVMAIESDTSRRIEITLQPPKPVDVSPAPALYARRSKAPAYVLGGVAALGAASFGFFALSGHSDFDRLHVCKPYCQASDVKRVQNKYLAADISLGVSLVALASAGYWLLSAPKEAPPKAENKPFSWAVSAAPGSAGLSLRWVE